MYDISERSSNAVAEALSDIEDDELDQIDFDELESQLEAELADQMADLELLEEDRKKIGNPESLGTTVMNVVWEQIINQIGVTAGEDFIEANRGRTLDLRNDAHIQTTDNFAKGKIATHNDQIDYQKRYDDWQSKFERNPDGSVKTHRTRTGREEANLARGARAPFDYGRPVGSQEKGTDMDHTVSAAEIIRDPAANAHLSQEEQVAFANSKANLNEMDSSMNRSKKDLPMTEWLDNPNSRGQKPSEIFDISEEKDRQLREKDAEARKEYDRVKKEGKKRSIETGRQSQRREAFRIGGHALRAFVVSLLADLIRKIMRGFVDWLQRGKKKIRTFFDSIKDSIKNFMSNLKQALKNAADALVTSVLTSIYGPVIGSIKKVYYFLKQGFSSLKQAINYIRNNKNKSFDILVLEVSKILVAGVSAAGAILLGDVIEKALLAIPLFAFQIPLFGSLASILGIFFGALVSGIIGATAFSFIDYFIRKKMEKQNTYNQIDTKNKILGTQSKLTVVSAKHLGKEKTGVYGNISQRHKLAGDFIRESMSAIDDDINNSISADKDMRELNDKLSVIMDDINSL